MQLYIDRLLLAIAFLATIGGGFPSIEHLAASDWPMWRANAQRTAYVPQALPTELHLQWQRDLTPATPAWPAGQDTLRFDDASNPVAMGQRIFVNSSTIDVVTAYDTRSGEQLWRFFADGPVRFAPAATAARVYFVSDDGFLYCLDAVSGDLVWKKRGGPSDRLILGNGRMISSWPARGAPVVHDGTVYFAASIWPFMGIFIHAVDAETGDTIWTNSGDGMNLTIQPHGAPSFATVVPQGHLVINNNLLIVPGGRSVPAVYDRHTGKLLHFEYVKKHGGHNVMAADDQYFVGGVAYRTVDGRQFDDIRADVYDEKHLISFQDSQFIGYATDCQRIETTTKNRLGRSKTKVTFQREKTWTQEVRGRIDKVLVKSGDILWTKRGNRVLAFDLTKKDERPNWVRQFDADVWDVLVSDDRLFVVTTDNRLHCFGSNRLANPKHFSLPKQIESPSKDEPSDEKPLPVDRLGSDVDSADGYALVVGFGSGRLVDALLEQTGFNVLVLPTQAEQRLVPPYREKLIRAGTYGKRVAILPTTTTPESLPRYFASLIVSESSDLETGYVLRLYDSLRPFGGKLCVPTDSARSAELRLAIEKAADPQARFEVNGAIGTLTRSGPLPNTDDWTHQYANAAQTGISQEAVVKSPLGVLWFGGLSHEGILPRHGHGPSPQVAGGRMVMEGPDLLRSIDIYTGRFLWEKSLPGLGTFYDNTKHMPGAGEIGSNYVTLADRVYVVYGDQLLELDAANGQTIREYGKSTTVDQPGSANWGYLGVDENYLVATSAPVVVIKADKVDAESTSEPATDVQSDVVKASENDKAELRELLEPTRFASGSLRINVFDRVTGERLWYRDADYSFRHNNISVADGKLFCIDMLSVEKRRALERRGLNVDNNSKLYAIDLRNGEVLWQKSDNVFGTFLNYSVEHDVLVQGGSLFRDRAYDEVGKGMVAYQGATGTELWSDLELTYNGPVLLWKDKIVTNGNGGFSIDMLTGKRTGWEYDREYGCNTAIGCQNLLTFRSGAAGYYDLLSDSGTSNLGGFRSSCTNNLIPAGGILNAPDYTRTCTCSYQNQTSLALIHMPEAEAWSFGRIEPSNATAVNFGAPGDRRDPNGTLWVDYPSVGGKSTTPSIRTAPPADHLQVFRLHSSLVSGETPWITASGVIGVREITIDVDSNDKKLVRLYFCEPKPVDIGQRTFEICANGQIVDHGFDVTKVAGRRHHGIMKVFEVTPDSKTIRITFAPSTTANDAGLEPIISGVEVTDKN